jgi:3-hydroxybutyryl-CoA dehydrogenase
MAGTNTFPTVFIAGSGFMGSAIAFLVASKTPAKVYVYDISDAQLDKAEQSVAKFGKSSVDKGFLAADKFEDVKKRVHKTLSLEDAKDSDIVIEAIAEDIEMKRSMFAKLDQICKPSTIFASNTSSLPITSMASSTKRAKQFIGMHFFSPAHIMKLVELIPGYDTSEETLTRVRTFSEELGKTIIHSKDFPGFITTRLGLILINEAAFALMEGLSTPKEIDLAMTLGYNHPMGPLTLADFIGLDVCLHVTEILYEGFGDPKYRPCPLLRQMVSAGHLGKKTGRGFYDYSGGNV